MARRIKGAGGGGGGHSATGGLRWLLTYADMITLLLALFIFFYSVSVISEEKVRAFGLEFAQQFGIFEGAEKPLPGGRGLLPYEKTLIERKARGKKLLKKIEQYGAIVKEGEQGVIITLTDQFLFAPGSAQLLPGAETILENVAFFLKEIVPDQYFRIEGHTDNSNIRSPLYPTNWELSACRSAVIARSLIDKFGIDSQRISIIGYGEYRPIVGSVDKQTKEEQAKNRRVEIVIEQ
ncbi:MAG: OmpA family protein [Candidatus Hydrogenedentota bacterium]